MSLDVTWLKNSVIVPTLTALTLYSDSAVNLMLGTCAQESHMGTYIRQIGGGPALGIYQTEPATHEDVWENYLKYRPALAATVLAIAPRNVNNLINSTEYATSIARLVYARVHESLPPAGNIQALASYWKQYYNTPSGKGCIADFILNYQRYVL